MKNIGDMRLSSLLGVAYKLLAKLLSSGLKSDGEDSATVVECEGRKATYGCSAIGARECHILTKGVGSWCYAQVRYRESL